MAPFSPRPPFRLYAGEEQPPREVDTASIVSAAKRGASEFVVLSPVKARPVLVLTEVIQPSDEVLALRLQRLEKLGDSKAQKRVREHADDLLFYLQPHHFPGLPVENAAIVSGLLRLPIAAVDTRAELGSLNENELRVVHERIAASHGLRLDMLVLEQARRLLERVRGT